ncbi:UNKNOWN [Stylonychia lemnae]|uniref:Arrestin-like N-terminal domain-containing protein n=1 Tax=Stylonychia lemnae TaxID=5949 RepID=A0A078A1P8_STYLE|nr:UNKNOWN [Stylonychia lemnae]|eukprot:CDW76035.1 UNKNOWN [Stylonychia lemnae]
MGNAYETYRFDSGYFVLQTDKPHYHPGDIVSGKIFIRCMRPVDAKQIDIEIQGKEKGSWMDIEYIEIIDSEGLRRLQKKDIKRKYRRNIIDHSGILFKFPPQGMIPGDFVIPFQFQLPQGVPATIFIKQEKHSKKLKGFIKYYIRGSLITVKDIPEMGYKQGLVVREKLQDDKIQSRVQQGFKIKTWCCLNKGISSLEIQLNQKIYEPDDKIIIEA